MHYNRVHSVQINDNDNDHDNGKIMDSLKLIQRYKSATKSYQTINVSQAETLNLKKGSVSVKHDGHLYAFVKDQDTWYLLNSSGHKITGLLALDSINESLYKADIYQAVFACELIYKANKADRPRAAQLNKALANNEIETNKDRFSIRIYDVLHFNSNAMWPVESWAARQNWITELFNTSPEFVHQEPISDLQELQDFYDSAITNDEEGVMFFDANTGKMYKIKPEHCIDAVIIGYTENAQAQIDSFWLALKNKEHELISLGRVNNTFHHELSNTEYNTLCNTLKNSHTQTTYKAVNNNSVVYDMVEPSIVVQCTSNDVLLSSGDKPLEKVALSHGPNGYVFRGKTPAPTALNLKLSHLRPDKTRSYEDIRIDQLYDIAGEKAPVKPLIEHARSTVLQRDVYTRKVSGAVCVRKIMAWATNKPAPEFAPYIVCYVDYSPARKEQPIKRYLVPTQSAKEAQYHVEIFIENNIKRGWSLASTTRQGVVS